MAGGVQASEDLLGGRLAPVGIVLTDVGVGVEPVVLHERIAPVEEDGQKALVELAGVDGHRPREATS
ncbi:MAG TPA: hypothetical protein VLK59_12130 [Solirubrobacteraceae bacterium]|nr:hypothetical protein [Solirubrobacteraceae bacterium]